MVNLNYNKGRQKEYRIKKKFEKVGYVCVRAAGSHSAFDLVAINPELKIIQLIQCKPNNFNKRAIERMVKQYEQFNGQFNVTYSVV